VKAGHTRVVKSEISVLDVESLNDPFDGIARTQLESLLPDFIAARRWFRAKARTIRRVEIKDVIPAGSGHAHILVIRLDYADGDSDEYLLPVAFVVNAIPDRTAGQQSAEGIDIVARFRTGDGTSGIVTDALDDRIFRSTLLNAIARSESFPGQEGELRASRTNAFPSEPFTDLGLNSSVSRAEQSNTSIIYGDRFILKLFRKLEPGINPDIEIGAFLTERGFRYIPAVLGTGEYTRKNDGSVYAAGILQEFVRNRGDAWKYTLESLGSFFGRALASGNPPPALESYHPMQLAAEPIPANLLEFAGAYVDAADRLGRRTAEMHAALADPQGGSNFAPEPFSSADGEKLYQEMLSQADIAFGLVRRKASVLKDAAAEDARLLLRMEHTVTERFAPLREQPITAARIRCHGDYHLGQVLWTGTRFVVIDFEGEPARPLSERRAKTLAMRDVAGMVRSFQYAAYAALFGQVSGVPMDATVTGMIESWAAFWTAWMSATFLNGYFDAADGLSFISATADERRVLFDSFLLYKALYEVAYELNNRPDWVRIPLLGILSLIT
jgi:trehalose synthase-fused probable maltokinase